MINGQHNLISRLLQEFGVALGKLVFSPAQERDHTDALPRTIRGTAQ